MGEARKRGNAVAISDEEVYGMAVHYYDEDVNLDIMVMIDFGISIPDIALKIQENVKNTVETMTGLKVSQVNIHIQGISFKKEKTELEEAKKEAKQAKKEAKKEESKKN